MCVCVCVCALVDTYNICIVQYVVIPWKPIGHSGFSRTTFQVCACMRICYLVLLPYPLPISLLCYSLAVK